MTFGFCIIVATDNTGGIARDGKIPWSCPADLKWFRRQTLGHVVIMGRVTWDTLPDSKLPGRTIVVMSRNEQLGVSLMQHDGRVLQVRGMAECLQWCALHHKSHPAQEFFVAGGAQIYNQFLTLEATSGIMQTKMSTEHYCDQFFTVPRASFHMSHTSPLEGAESVGATIHTFTRTTYEMDQVRDVVRLALHSPLQKARTGGGAHVSLHHMMHFDLRHGQFPMLSWKPVWKKGVFEELNMMLNGWADSKILEAKNVNVWEPNTTREFLDAHNLQHLREGDMGPTYGFQMRHFGAEYRGADAHKRRPAQGMDQLMMVIRLLRTDPYNRRIIISLWNPEQLDEMALPPCVHEYTFNVTPAASNDPDRRPMLSCLMKQRSSDISLAGGWNVAHGAMLTCMLAHCVGMRPRRLSWVVANAHVYSNQVEAATELVRRESRPMPFMSLRDPPKIEEDATPEDCLRAMLLFKVGTFNIFNYNPNAALRMEMNA